MSVERAGSAGPGKARVWFATPQRLFAKGRVR